MKLILLALLLICGTANAETVNYSPSYTGGASGSLTAPVQIGTPAISDTGILLQATSSVAGFNQFIIQNTNSGTSASSNYVVNNNLGNQFVQK